MTDHTRKRVVVTGVGAITPIGNTATEYWDGLLSGRNGIDYITFFDASSHDCRIAGEVKTSIHMITWSAKMPSAWIDLPNLGFQQQNKL